MSPPTKYHREELQRGQCAVKTPNQSIIGFPGAFTLFKAGANVTLQERLKRLTTFPLGERPPILVCLEAPELHIRVLWGTQLVTPSFTKPTPEDSKVLAFTQDIRLGQLPARVVVLLEWLTSSKVSVQRTSDTEAELAHLSPGHPMLAADNPQPDRFSVTQDSLAPLSLVNPLMVFPFLPPSNTWYMMHAKADTMRITQWVTPFMAWLRVKTVEPQKGIATLTSVYLAKTIMDQR